MSECLLTPAYPTDFPVDAARQVIATVRGQSPVNNGIHAGWVVLGFGLGHYLPCDVQPLLAVADAEERLATLLEQAAAVQEPQGLKAINLPWDQLIQLMMIVLAKWLQS